MTPLLPLEAVEISERLWCRDKLSWLAKLAEARRLGVTLLELIYARYLELREMRK